MTDFSVAIGVGRREPLQRIGELAKAIEGYGFKALYVQDNPLSTKDAFMALTVAALNTDKIILGPGVSNPLVRHLSVIANSMMTLDQVSEGRALLGFGSGGIPLVEALGLAPRKIREFRQDLSDIRSLLRGEEAESGSVRYTIPGIERHIPVHVAVRGPRMLRLAGELADGALVGATAQADVLAGKIETVRAAAKDAGRDQADVRINLLVNMATDMDSQPAVEALRPFVVSTVVDLGPSSDEVPWAYDDTIRKVQEVHDPSKHLAANTPESELIPDELVKLVTIAGSEEECRDRLKAILGLQPDEITFPLMSGGRVERLRLLANVSFGA